MKGGGGYHSASVFRLFLAQNQASLPFCATELSQGKFFPPEQKEPI
jgi:hypothetical protein